MSMNFFTISELKAPEIITPDAIKFQKHLHGFLSNFHTLESPIVDEFGFKYATSEHYYQSRKSDNPLEWRNFSTQKGHAEPNKAKKDGKLLEKRANWDEFYKYGVMRNAIFLKFHYNPQLKAELSQLNAQLIEWCTWDDQCWGMYSRTKTGANALGKLLMEYKKNHL